METPVDAPEADPVFFIAPALWRPGNDSDDPRDLSAMDWHAFVAAYKPDHSARRGALCMKRGRFVVGDPRWARVLSQLRGAPRFVYSRNARGFTTRGNLLQANGHGSDEGKQTIHRQSKVGKLHQNVLVFCKGDWKKAAARCAAGI